MMGFSSTLEPFRAANRLAQRALYEWKLLSLSGGPINASNHIVLDTEPLTTQLDWVQLLMVFAGLNPLHCYSNALARSMQNFAHRRGMLAGISTGPFLLAKAGLLNGYRATLHWENIAQFSEQFPQVKVTQNIFEIDRQRATCAGGTAGLDLALLLIAEHQTPELATQVSAQFMHDRVRTSEHRQQLAVLMYTLRRSAKLGAAVELMSQHLESPLSSTDIADRVQLSPRQLERLFKQHCHTTPRRFYTDLRLRQARQLLLETGLSILSVSLATGFASQSHFTRCYRERYDRTPSQDRLKIV